MKYYIIAGEKSGDIHGANLMREIRNLDATATFRFWGGDEMLKVSPVGLVKHIKELAFMGFVEVLFNIRTILNNISLCKKDILNFSPDVVVFIDYPGFNLRMVKFCKLNQFKTIYYISPQIWAWKEGRINIIKKFVDRLYVILPFEKQYYIERGFNRVEFVGHPLLDQINQYTAHKDLHSFMLENTLDNSKIIALLPGSRKQEIKKMLPLFAKVSTHPYFHNYHFVICGVSFFDVQFYKHYFQLGIPEYKKDFLELNHSFFYKNVSIVFDKTYDVLKYAKAAMVTSGTATLETALFNVPQLVCYKGNPISYYIAKKLVKIKYISLVNLILEEEAVKEFIQQEATVDQLVTQLKHLTHNNEYIQNQLDKYKKLHHMLGGIGASKKVAGFIVQNMKQ